MFTANEYLDSLDNDKETLVDNLNTMGVEASDEETFTELAPKVLEIPQSGTSDYDELTNKPSINSVTLTGNKSSSDLGLQETIQFTTMPTPSADYVGKIVQYVGLTGGNYREGSFYRCIEDQSSIPATYYWEIVNTGETIQFAIIPPARAENEGQIIQYTGITDSSYTNGYFYKCTSDGATIPTYDWVNINVQSNNTDYSNLSNKPSINSVTLDGNKTSADLGIEQIQYNVMPTPSVDNVGHIVQYIGNTTSSFTKGYFYICYEDPNTSGTYSWGKCGVQDDASGEPTYIIDWSDSDADTLLVLQAIYNEFATYNHLPLSYVKNSDDYTMLSNVKKDINWIYFTFSTITNVSTQSSKTYVLSTNHAFTSLHSKNTYTKNIQDQLVSGTNIKTINNTTLLDSGNIDTEVIQYSTIPTADATTVGKIVQFTGTTDATYTNGYFYIGATDGQATPTYSWTQLNVQPSSGGSDETIYVLQPNDNSAPALAIWQKVYDEIKNNNTLINLYMYLGSNYLAKISPYYDYNIPGVSLSVFRYYMNYAEGGSSAYIKTGTITLSVTNDTVTNLSHNVLNRDLATKGYVGDYFTIISGYDATKTQVLKNVNGTLTWVTET